MKPIIYKLDKERVLKINFRAIARLEKSLNSKATKWGETLTDISFEQTAIVLSEAMRHDTPDITAEQVMDLIEGHSIPNDAKVKAYQCINEYFGKNASPAKETKAEPEPEAKETAILN